MFEWDVVPYSHVADRLRSVSTNTTPDVALLRKEVDWVEEEAERKARHKKLDPSQDIRWKQGNWIEADWKDGEVCGTNCCVAGNVAVHTGATLIFQNAGDRDPYALRDEDGNYWAIAAYASDRLGLTSGEQEMFEGDNDAKVIRAYAEDAAARVGEKL